MDKIKEVDVQKHLNELIRPSKAGKKPLSRSTVKKVLDILNMVFRRAVENKDIPWNPVEKIQLPKEEMFLTKTKETFCLTDEEMSKIKVIADTEIRTGEPKWRYGSVFMVMLNTGLRCGEQLGLK